MLMVMIILQIQQKEACNFTNVFVNLYLGNVFGSRNFSKNSTDQSLSTHLNPFNKVTSCLYVLSVVRVHTRIIHIVITKAF